MRAIWSDRENCSHSVFHKFKRISRFSSNSGQSSGELRFSFRAASSTELRWAKSPIASVPVRNAVNSHRPCRSSTWIECYTNEHQSRDAIRSTTNAGSMRTNFYRDITANKG